MNGLLLLALVSLSGVTWAQDPLQLTIIPPGIIKKGDTLKIECDIPSLGAFDVVRIIRMVDVEDNQGNRKKKTVVLSVNDQNQKTNPSRYSLDANYSDKRFTLTIENVDGGDGGEIGCEHMAKLNGRDERNEAMEFVTVFVPTKKVELRVKQDNGDWMPVMDGAKISMREGFMDGVQCFVEVEGSDPAIKPKIHFKFGSKDVRAVDKVKHELKVDDGLDENNVRELYYRSQYEYVTDMPDRHYNGKVVTCSAKMEHYDLVSRTAELDIQYKPEVKCPKKTYARLAEEARITCTVKMNPEASQSSWSWVDAEGNETILNIGEEQNGFSAEQSQKEDGTWEFSLVFTSVEATYFHDYSFTVDNGLSDPIKSTVRFLKDEEEPEPEIPSTTTQTPTDNKSDQEDEKSDPKMNEVSDSGAPRALGSIITSLVTLLLASLLARS